MRLQAAGLLCGLTVGGLAVMAVWNVGGGGQEAGAQGGSSAWSRIEAKPSPVPLPRTATAGMGAGSAARLDGSGSAGARNAWLRCEVPACQPRARLVRTVWRTEPGSAGGFLRVADSGTDATAGPSSSSAQHEGQSNTTQTAQAGGENLSAADRKFMTKAAGGGLFEAAVGSLASQKGESQGVKDFGAMLNEHHSMANQELEALAAAKGVKLPSEMPKDKKKTIDRLSRADGQKFDRQFVKQVGIKDHEKDIADFEKAAGETKDPELKAWITKTLPNLRKHLETAQQLAETTGAKPSSN